MFSFLLSSLIYGRPKRTLYSKKYGVDLIRYTHAANTVVYSSNKIDGMLMLKDLFVVFVAWVSVIIIIHLIYIAHFKDNVTSRCFTKLYVMLCCVMWYCCCNWRMPNVSVLQIPNGLLYSSYKGEMCVHNYWGNSFVDNTENVVFEKLTIKKYWFKQSIVLHKTFWKWSCLSYSNTFLLLDLSSLCGYCKQPVDNHPRATLLTLVWGSCLYSLRVCDSAPYRS